MDGVGEGNEAGLPRYQYRPIEARVKKSPVTRLSKLRARLREGVAIYEVHAALEPSSECKQFSGISLSAAVGGNSDTDTYRALAHKQKRE